MPRRRGLVRAGRADLVTRVAALGAWASVAVALGFEASRKPDGYWENIDLLRDARLQLVHAFWFEETETAVERTAEEADEESGDDASSDDSLPPIEVIRNRPIRAREESSSSDSGDEE